ncbi:DNA binding domain protein [Gordonia phage Arri]|uniref:DNA binding domain protein n=1 Tax=Gordonia phage Arri TaxID=2588127 RepID=A0A4Y5U0A2_9CAUD|nr:DNA binding domain protein [Gordonia phage Arri]QDB74795.1 ribbon-helix-helix DNA binding domain protein [Gordonia phage Arri]
MANNSPNTRGLTPGGSSLSGDGSHSPRVSVSLPTEAKARLEEVAAAHGMGASKYIRRLVLDHLATID